jgi:hypothetical protein
MISSSSSSSSSFSPSASPGVSGVSGVSDYSFHNMGRIGLDAADGSVTALSNTKYANHMMTNYFADQGPSYRDFALNQPDVYFQGGVTNTSVIDVESMLYLDQSLRGPDRILLNQRSFLTLPYLGRGSANPDLETKLMIGDCTSQKKSVGTTSETPLMDYSTYPMLDQIKSSIQNPKFIVQEDAQEGWSRGGMSTREP